MDKRSFIFVLALSAGLFFVNQWFSPTQDQKAPTETSQQAEAVVEKPAEKAVTPPPVATEGENYYVLSNDLQQVVFSTTGGSVAEINLPFKTENNEEIAPSGITRKDALKKMGKYAALTALGTFMILNPKRHKLPLPLLLQVVVVEVLEMNLVIHQLEVATLHHPLLVGMISFLKTGKYSFLTRKKLM